MRFMIDNTPIAWADVAAGGAIQSDFGIEDIKSPKGGVYVIALHLKDATIDPATLSQIAVTATLRESDLNYNDNTHGCGSITVTSLGASWPTSPAPTNSGIFIIRTYDSSCDLDGTRPFEFHVFGR